MDTIIHYPTDFRAEAANASLVTLERHGINEDAADLSIADLSLCVPIQGDSGQARRKVKRAIILSLFYIFALIAIGFLIAFPAANQISIWSGISIVIWRILGLVVAAIGWVGMCSLVNIENYLARRLLRLSPRPGFVETEPIAIVKIEDPSTCQQTKLLVDDLALLYCDAARKLMVLEGLSYRYVIRADDICQNAARPSLHIRHLIVSYRISDSDKILSLALFVNGAMHELKRQLSLNRARPPFVSMYERTMGISIPISWPR